MIGRVKQQFGIDLGTCNTVIYQYGRGIVLLEPSVIAIRKDTQGIVAYGEQAKAMIGRTSAKIEVFYPLNEGVIANFEMAAAMLKHFISRIKDKSTWFGASQIIISVPCGISNVQRRAIEKMVLHNGAGKALAVMEPLAAALGEGLPVNDPAGCMVIDIGGSTSKVALISMDRIVASQSIPRGGMSIDLEIIEYMKKNYNLAIGERTAEAFKIEAALALKSEQEESIEIKGRDLKEGLPKTIFIPAEELKGMLDDFTLAIINCTQQAMKEFPPELIGDLWERGILLCGGGSLLPGLHASLQTAIGVSVHLAEKPLECVALGAGALLLNHQPDMPSKRLNSADKGDYQGWFKIAKENKPARIV
jgi:rod shape-determining protein MreB